MDGVLGSIASQVKHAIEETKSYPRVETSKTFESRIVNEAPGTRFVDQKEQDKN